MFDNEDLNDYTEEEVDIANKELAIWEELVHKKKSSNFQEEIETQTKEIPYETMMELLKRPCKTEEELKNWIKVFLHIDLPDKTVDPDSNSNPLKMVWDLYSTAIYYDIIPPKERLIKSLFYCSRGSFKTLCCCIVELLVMIHSNRNICHIGLIEQQAKNAYQMYLRPFFDKPYIKDLKVSSILEKSVLTNKDGDDISIQVLPCTLNRTSSPRAQLVAKDEVDKTKGEQVIAYKNISGMLTMTNDKKFAMEFDISSRDSSYGMVQQIIDNSDKNGTKIFHWNRIDITEKCPDERSGNIPIEIYIKRDTLVSISKEEFELKPIQEKALYEKNWGLEGCLKNCKIFAACRGYLKNQESKCKWLKPVEETENAILTASDENMAISQLLCRKPPKTGLVYGDFETNKNVKTPAEMYEIFAGEKHENPNLSVEELIFIFRSYNIFPYIGADAGFHNPACLLVFIDKGRNVYVLKEYMVNEIDSMELAENLKKEWLNYEPRMTFSDPESPDLASSLRKSKFTVSKKVIKNVQAGIATVKGLLRLPATQKTKIFINPDCIGLRTEFGKYAYVQNPDGTYSDNIVKKNDHALDALRYVLHTLFNKRGASLGYEEKANKKGYNTVEEYYKSMISPETITQNNGIRLNISTVEDKKTKKNARFDIDDY